MIALLTTYFIVAYVLIPGALFRFPASLYVRLRLFQLTKVQEVTFGAAVALAPFLLALLAVWHAPAARHQPFAQPEGSSAAYRTDQQRLLTLVVAEDASRLLATAPGEKNPYLESLGRIERRQLRFLCWYYLFIALEGLGFGYLAHKYGDWQQNRAYSFFARKVMLPRVSEWQLLLTDFNFPKTPRRMVFADVLSEEHLYRGTVEDYFLDLAGALSGVLLKNVERFKKHQYAEAVQKASGTGPGSSSGLNPHPDFGPDEGPGSVAGGLVDPDLFWTPIPGANFYIPADKIANINVRFPFNDIELARYIQNYLQQEGLSTDVTVTPPVDPPAANESDLP
jgi:hypothetical protein